MNIRTRKNKQIIAVFLLLNFISSIFPYNALYANNNGPNAPEAAAFEPVDATDMVNLLTGDFSYVLPLLNVPASEGGYPIALNYHSGIAMDQEASWVGLGWNLNPGAINRIVNKKPDDYCAEATMDYFWSKEEVIEQNSFSIGWSDGIYSVGVGLSWGSHKATSGFVSFGIGAKIGEVGVNSSLTVGTNGVASVGVGVGYSGLSIGVDVTTKGEVSGSAGLSHTFSNGNKLGFSMSTSGKGSFNLGLGEASMSVGLSSKGVDRLGFSWFNNTTSVSSLGAGASYTSETVSAGAYSTSSSSNLTSIAFPLPSAYGFINLSFGKQTFIRRMDKSSQTMSTGTLHYSGQYEWEVQVIKSKRWNYYSERKTVGSYKYAQKVKSQYDKIYKTDLNPDITVEIVARNPEDNYLGRYVYFEYNTVSLSESADLQSVNLSGAVMPSYDNYFVSSQGLSGVIEPKFYRNGMIIDIYDNHYDPSASVHSDNDVIQFKQMPYFCFKNEISSYIETPTINPDAVDIDLSYGSEKIRFGDDIHVYTENLPNKNKSEFIKRRKTSRFIDFRFNNQIVENYEEFKKDGFLRPVCKGFDRANIDESIERSKIQGYYEGVYKGVGAFKITDVDGKTYHYSLPVYNYETITRDYGTFKDYKGKPRDENKAYHETFTNTPYATHWLLTAVTGPDFVDTNDNGIADRGDYGYWVSLEYGKYSNSFIWGAPYGKSVEVSPISKNMKTWKRGRKDLVYLNKIKTSTHTAIFVKSERYDSYSLPFSYSRKVEMPGGTPMTDYAKAFELPIQRPLKLDKIILMRGDFDIEESSKDLSKHKESYAIYPKSLKDFERDFHPRDFSSYLEYLREHERYTNINDSDDIDFQLKKFSSFEAAYKVKYDMYNNVIDSDDDQIKNLDVATNKKVIKVIKFDYNYNLVKGAPNSIGGKLTLNKVIFKGKMGKDVLPPYKFSYVNPDYNFNLKDKADSGYVNDMNDIWSLNQITTPNGAKIAVEYEPHEAIPIFKPLLQTYYNDGFYEGLNNKPLGDKEFSFEPDLSKKEGVLESVVVPFKWKGIGGNFLKDGDKFAMTQYFRNKKGELTYHRVNKGAMRVHKQQDKQGFGEITFLSKIDSYKGKYTFIEQLPYEDDRTFKNLGSRVKSVSTIDEQGAKYTMNYTYGQPEKKGVGYVFYLPPNKNILSPLPYISELPSPKVMYDYVTTDDSVYNPSLNLTSSLGVKTEYHFNIPKRKEGNKLGDFFEITKTYPKKDYYTEFNLIKDNLSSIGQLLEVKTFNKEGQLLSHLKNNYFKPGETPDKIGMTKESYQTYQDVEDNKTVLKSVYSSRITYPNLLKSTSELKNGKTNYTKFSNWDPISGQPSEIYLESSTGRKIKSKKINAFRQYPKMGSKVDDINNKNMLSQVAGEVNYLYNNKWNVIGANLQTWSDDWEYRDYEGVLSSPSSEKEKIWRKHKTFSWNGNTDKDGIYTSFDSENFDNFVWNSLDKQTDPDWKEESEVTLYDHFSRPLEVKIKKDNSQDVYQSTKMTSNLFGINNVSATAVNAMYTEMFYSGSEILSPFGVIYDGEISLMDEAYPIMKDKNFSREVFHTGLISIAVKPNVNTFHTKLKAGEHRDGRYKLSVWVQRGSEDKARVIVNDKLNKFNGEQIVAGEWVLLNHYIDLLKKEEYTIGIRSVKDDFYADDFRFHPVAAAMNSYVYNELGELTYIISPNGLATHYKYNDAGELKEVWQEVIDAPGLKGGFKLISSYSKNYKK